MIKHSLVLVCDPTVAYPALDKLRTYVKAGYERICIYSPLSSASDLIASRLVKLPLTDKARHIELHFTSEHLPYRPSMVIIYDKYPLSQLFKDYLHMIPASTHVSWYNDDEIVCTAQTIDVDATTQPVLVTVDNLGDGLVSDQHAHFFNSISSLTLSTDQQARWILEYIIEHKPDSSQFPKKWSLPDFLFERLPELCLTLPTICLQICRSLDFMHLVSIPVSGGQPVVGSWSYNAPNSHSFVVQKDGKYYRQNWVSGQEMTSTSVDEYTPCVSASQLLDNSQKGRASFNRTGKVDKHDIVQIEKVGENMLVRMDIDSNSIHPPTIHRPFIIHTGYLGIQIGADADFVSWWLIIYHETRLQITQLAI